jgi:hypothetical protein
VAIIGGVVIDPKTFLRVVSQHDVHVLRTTALHARDVFAVVTELDDEIRFIVEREFGIDDFVAPRPVGARGLDPQQKVGLTEERAVEKRAPVDDGCAALHGADRLGGRALDPRK